MLRSLQHCKSVNSSVSKYFLIIAGGLSLVLGVIGIVVPLLPTTPFILLSAACFAKSSPKFHQWLLQHAWFGPLIKNYRNGQGIPQKLKIRIIIFIWITLSISMLVTGRLWICLMLAALGLGLTVYLWKMPAPK